MRRFRLQDRGATLVEFALVAPILFLLVFGLIEFGRYQAISTQVTTAAREAARFGIATGIDGGASVPQFVDCDGIRDAGRQKTPMLNLAYADIDITYDTGPASPDYLTCTTSAVMDPTSVQDNSRVTVTVSTTFTTPVPLIATFLNGSVISATDTRTITEQT